MATTGSADSSRAAQVRASAINHAQDLEYKKSMRDTVLDLIVDNVDIPSKPGSDPAHPLPADVTLFKRGLHLFQASDFDDLILERNIYDKCGYSLCGRPNIKLAGKGQNAVIWGKSSGSTFAVVPKRDLEKWCSKECEQRALYVRLQLGKGPAWIRDQPIGEVKLLDESRQAEAAEALVKNMGSLNMQTSASHPDFANDLHKLAMDQVERHDGDDQVTERLQTLSLERGKPQSSINSEISMTQVVEKFGNQGVTRPPQLADNTAWRVEGHRPKKVRFATSYPGDGEDERSDSEVDMNGLDDGRDDDAMSE